MNRILECFFVQNYLRDAKVRQRKSSSRGGSLCRYKSSTADNMRYQTHSIPPAEIRITADRSFLRQDCSFHDLKKKVAPFIFLYYFKILSDFESFSVPDR